MGNILEKLFGKRLFFSSRNRQLKEQGFRFYKEGKLILTSGNFVEGEWNQDAVSKIGTDLPVLLNVPWQGSCSNANIEDVVICFGKLKRIQDEVSDEHPEIKKYEREYVVYWRDGS
ncbi:hypothetical protein HOG16_02330 [Candidatus Woesearchaeota archaeon]|jgi:hypothetical protein|nr:hypothetical protein [archaeon]MBT3691057.1 hypothetical protein [Candidatus Woesearchaeota archaeon]MBT4373770.1 hypothetical protein [archaeon]MBT4532236.1 hypothetical protein [archaeon]MBT7001061.1 hypothetical protein [archaeon]